MIMIKKTQELLESISVVVQRISKFLNWGQ